jgi:hypothetical protein
LAIQKSREGAQGLADGARRAPARIRHTVRRLDDLLAESAPPFRVLAISGKNLQRNSAFRNKPRIPTSVHRRPASPDGAPAAGAAEADDDGILLDELAGMIATELTRRYGRGYSWQNLFRMATFAELYPDPQIFSPLARILTLTTITEVLTLEPPAKRDFYLTLCARERCPKRTLRVGPLAPLPASTECRAQ